MIYISHFVPAEGIDALVQEVQALRVKTPGTHLGVAPNAWSSPKTDSLGPVGDRVLQCLVNHLIRYEEGQVFRIEVWANILWRGSSIGWHDHVSRADGATNEPNVWSAIYYLTTGGAKTFFENGRSFDPFAGQMLVFPATLKHSVPPHPDERERLTLSFNARYL